MRPNWLFLLLLAALLPAVSATAQVEPLVLHQVTVVDVIDATSWYVIPGLWDMHVHTFNNNVVQPPNEWTFPLYLAHGVTGIRDMWVKPGDPADQVRAWRRELEEGSFVGPRFGDVGTLVNGTPPVQPGADTVVTPEKAGAYVGELQAAGIDFVKVYSHLSPEVYEALVNAARDAGLYVAPHARIRYEVKEWGRMTTRGQSSPRLTMRNVAGFTNGLLIVKRGGVVVGEGLPGKHLI